jgi:hypothetical protein
MAVNKKGMTEELLALLGIKGRLEWYKLHVDEKSNLSKNWNCFLHEVQGTVTGQTDLDLHRLAFGPDISTARLRPLMNDQYHILESIKPGTIPGVLLF